ncbi:MAG: glycosyltransferase [Vicingaceae bacterium]
MDTTNERPLISVRLMTFNHAAYIRDAMDGIMKQETSFSVEVVVGDDFSTDGTLDIIREYKDTGDIKIKILDREEGGEYWIMRQEKGRLYNFSNILDNCKGKYIALLDGDDYWTDSLKLQKQVDFLEENQEFNICFHKVNVLKGNEFVSDDYVESRYPSHKNSVADLFDLLRHDNFIHTPSVVFRNTGESLPIEFFHSPVGDYLLHITSAHYGKIKRFDEKMAVYRKGAGIYSTISKQEKLKKVIMYQACILSYLKNDEAKEIVLNQISQSINKSYAVESLLAKEISFRNLIKLFIIKLRQLMKSNES